MSSLTSRIGLVALNFAILLPVFAVLLTSAILSSIIQNNLKKFTDTSVAQVATYIKRLKWTLWILTVGGILFFIFGIILLPTLMLITYLYSFLTILLAIGYLVISGYFFYASVIISKSTDYKNKTAESDTAYKDCVRAGLLMMFAGIFMIGYAVWSSFHYYKIGGIKADIGYIVAPEAAIAKEVSTYAPEYQQAYKKLFPVE